MQLHLLAYKWLRGIVGASAESPRIRPPSTYNEETSAANKCSPDGVHQTDTANPMKKVVVWLGGLCSLFLLELQVFTSHFVLKQILSWPNLF